VQRHLRRYHAPSPPLLPNPRRRTRMNCERWVGCAVQGS
jgi:hypothetical protein